MQFGDMAIVGKVPPKLAKALSVISSTMHQTFAIQPWIAHPDKSKGSCILSSLAVRDFLFKIGFTDAEVACVIVAIRAFRDGEEIHSLGVGLPLEGIPKTTATNWNGHMVVKLPSLGYLIDTTLFQAKREQWKALPGSMVVPYDEGRDDMIFGHRALSGFHNTTDGTRMDIFWLDHPDKKSWKKGGDAIKWRREAAVEKMLERFRSMKETDNAHS